MRIKPLASLRKSSQHAWKGKGAHMEKKKSGTSKGLGLLFSWISKSLLLSSSNGSFLLDACGLTCELAQVVEFRTTNFTMLVHLDRIDVR